MSVRPGSKLILNWTPVLVKLKNIELLKVEKKFSRFFIYYVYKTYAIPFPLYFASNFEIRERKFTAIVRIIEKEGRLTKYYNFNLPILRVELLQPNRPIEELKYKLVFAKFYGKSTRMGAVRKTIPITKPLFKVVSSSSGGTHWETLFAWLVPVNERIIVHHNYVSNRGNASQSLIDVETGESVPIYEELKTIKSWTWGRVVKMRENLTGKTFTALILEYHQARKTGAYTTHRIEPEDAVEPIEDTSHSTKTHWTRTYIVTKPCVVKTIRVSNRGNVSEYTVQVNP